MLVSLRWLQDYVDIDLSPGELADRLTMAGLEVDAVETRTPAFSGVVVGKVLSVSAHPDADKLRLCEVSTGAQTYRVVCGAPNLRTGMISAFAAVGAVLPGGFTIKQAKIRGQQSDGMLCSEQELGIGDDASGIIELPETLTPGEDLASALGLNDTVFDICITPNRSDCLSITGIAREVAAITCKPFRYPVCNLTEREGNIAEIASVKILDPDLCPRYTARLIRNVKIAPSPRWMRLRLEAVGLRAINNIVDITNFVMLELGQPLHAFDYHLLEEGRIVVRRAIEGEAFTSLDGKDRSLSADTLMICDGAKPVAVAGVMGGQNSEVQDNSQDILLESAYFDPSSIRRTAKRLGMPTDAAYRFERGIDPEGLIRALDRAAQLMADCAEGEIVEGIIDAYPRQIERAANITLASDRIGTVLGTDLCEEEIVALLKVLNMEVMQEGKRLSVTPPSYRVDIKREEDLIEEVARLYGYGLIPETIPEIKTQPDRDMRHRMVSKIRTCLTGDGYTEVINYSFTTPESVEALRLGEADNRRRFIRILNPLSEDQSVMRTSPIYGLLDTMRRNLNTGNTNLRFFEKGKVFLVRDGSLLPDEPEKLCGLLSGTRHEGLWNAKGTQIDFYDIKGSVEKLLDALGLTGARYIASTDQPYLHPGRACCVSWNDRVIGYFGEVHPDVLSRMDIRVKALIFELDVDSLADGYSEQAALKDVPRFPPSYRDVSFLVDRSVDTESLLRAALSERQELLEKIEVFDVYMGPNIPESAKSIALRFTYRSAVKTLTDDEINGIHMKLVKNVADTTSAKIRGE